VDIEVVFTEPGDTAELLPGYSADAEVIVATRDDVLRLPTEAVLDRKRVYVYLSGQGRIEQREITPGIANWDFTEAVSGVAAGGVVISTDRPGEDGAAVLRRACSRRSILEIDRFSLSVRIRPCLRGITRRQAPGYISIMGPSGSGNHSLNTIGLLDRLMPVAICWKRQPGR
jgi:hypothetical protein